MRAPFNEDMIRRSDLPRDVFGLIHDIAYHHDGRDVENYVERAPIGNAIVPQIAEWIGQRIQAVAAPKQVSLKEN